MLSGETFGTEDPRTGEIYAQVAEAQEADVDAAVKAARMVQPFAFHHSHCLDFCHIAMKQKHDCLVSCPMVTRL